MAGHLHIRDDTTRPRAERRQYARSNNLDTQMGGTLQSYDFVGSVDVNNKPVLNSAGKKFSEGTGLKKRMVSFTFSQYEPSTLTIDEIADRNDVINDNSFKGFAEKTLLLNVRGFEYGTFYGYQCVRIDYQLTYKKDTWIEKRLDIGDEYWDPGPKGTGKLVTALNKAGCQTEVRLDGSGRKLAESSPDVFVDVERYEESDFSSFLR